VFLTGDPQADAARIMALIETPHEASTMARAARATWTDTPLYRDEVLARLQTFSQSAA
jgi:hypothetical protein